MRPRTFSPCCVTEPTVPSGDSPSVSPSAAPADGVFVGPGPPRVARLHQPPGAEDHPDGASARPLRLTAPRPGRLGDPQGRQWPTLLLQPLHPGEDLEAAASQGRRHGPCGPPQHRRECRGESRAVGGREEQGPVVVLVDWMVAKIWPNEMNHMFENQSF